MKIKKTRSRDNESIGYMKNKNIISIIPIICIIAVVPLIVYLKPIQLKDTVYQYWNGSKTNGDLFSYYKMVYFLIFTSIATLSFIITMYIKKKTIKHAYLYIPMAAIAILTIVSTLNTDYIDIAINGFPDRYEGMYAILGYMLILFITINIIDEEKQIEAIFYSLIVSGLIIGTIGIFQYFGLDFFRSNIGKIIMLPKEYEPVASEMKFFDTKNSIYSTLYHYNYVGSYMAMLFPLSLVLFWIQKEKKKKIFLGLFSLLMFINWIGCRSRAGVVGGVFALIILFIILGKKIFKNKKVVLITLISLLIVFIGIDTASKGSLRNKLLSIYLDPQVETKGEKIDEIAYENGALKIKTNNSVMNLILVSHQVIFTDEKYNPIKINIEGNNISFYDDRYKQYNAKINIVNNNTTIDIGMGGAVAKFAVVDNKIKMLNYRGVPTDIEPIKKWGFEGKESLGSARGYIWSRSIPLLKSALLYGYGPDTFAAVFPQNDSVGKLKAYGTAQILVDKPHNFYLQTAMNTGVISLLAVLVLFIYYFISSIRYYTKNDLHNFKSVAGLAVFVAFCGYIGAAFFNDSVVSVAPVFWVLLGMGISINMSLKKQISQK